MGDLDALKVKPRKPPRVGPLVACTLELAMLAAFVVERSWIGVALWFSYLWFSATWAAFSGFFDLDED